jgi:hypothetical protein
MALVSLKQESEGYEGMECCGSGYGYGTSIQLTCDQCEALGITKMAAGQPVFIKANGIVTRSTESIEDEGKEVSVSIQLTEIEVRTAGSANANAAAKKLYGTED